MPMSTLLARFSVYETHCRAVLVNDQVFVERREVDRMGVERWVEIETLSTSNASLVRHLAEQLDYKTVEAAKRTEELADANGRLLKCS
jgi:hypothetical protein